MKVCSFYICDLIVPNSYTHVYIIQTLDRLMAPLSQLDIDVRNRLVPSEIPIKSVYNPDVDFFVSIDKIYPEE